MKIRSHWLLLVLVLAVAVLAGRLTWAFRHSTIVAWQHRDLWLNLAALTAGVERRPLGDKAPEDQARFWLAEVERVRTDDDPQLALGAAWLIDGPQFGFIRQHFRMNDRLRGYPQLPVNMRVELDHEAIRSESKKFERLCRAKCLAKIATAVRLDRNNAEMWRARALLMFQCEGMSLDFEPRGDDWLPILDECATHDPDNALYDYLAALQLWSMSAEYQSVDVDDGYTIKKNDAATFDRGTARLKVGLAKPHLKFGTVGYGATMAFLEKSSIAPTKHVAVAASREINGRATRCLHRILRWQSAILDVAKRDQNFAAARDAARTKLKVADQMSKAGNHPNGVYFKQLLRYSGLDQIKELGEHPENGIEVAEAKRVAAELKQVQLKLEIQNEASELLHDSAREEKRAGEPSFVVFMTAGQTLVIAATGLAIGFGLLFLLVGSRGNAGPSSFGWLRQTISWVVGIGGSFVLLGMCPAEIIPPIVQTWVVRGAIWLGFVLLLLIPPFLCRRWIGLPLSQFAVLGAGVTLPLAAALHSETAFDLALHAFARTHLAVLMVALVFVAWLCWASARVLASFVRGDFLSRRRKFAVCGIVLLFALSTVAAGSAVAFFMSEQIEVKAWIAPGTLFDAPLEFTATELQDAMRPKASDWFWAFLQWQIHRGALVGTFAAVAVLLAWHAIAQSKSSAGGFREILRSQKRHHLSQASAIIAESALIVSLVCLLPYLATSPAFVDSAMAKHHKERERVVNAPYAWNELESAIAQIKADETVMTRLKNEIAEPDREAAEQKRRSKD